MGMISEQNIFNHCTVLNYCKSKVITIGISISKYINVKYMK